MITRHLQDGQLDNTFGAGGKATVIFEVAVQDDEATDVLFIEENNLEKLMVFGHSNDDFALALLASDGQSFDNNFGSLGGRERTDLAAGSVDQVFDGLKQADGKILLLGNSNEDIALVRYNSDGSLDTSFGNGTGIVITDINNQNIDFASKVKLQEDGKIIVLASTGENENQDVALLRYNPDGSLDNSFGTQGKQIIDINNGSTDAANALLIQPDKKILVGSTSSADVDSPAQFVVLRLLGEAEPDGGGGGPGEAEPSAGGCSLRRY